MPLRAGVRRAPRTIEVATCSMPKNIGKGGALTTELKLVKDVLSHVFGDVYEQVDFQCCATDSANGAVEVNVRLAAECGLKVGYQSGLNQSGLKVGYQSGCFQHVRSNAQREGSERAYGGRAVMDNGDSNPQDPMHDLRYTISERYVSNGKVCLCHS